MQHSKTTRRLSNGWHRLTRKGDGCLYRAMKESGNNIQQLIVPTAMLQQILEALHDSAGHQASAKTLQLARSQCYWPNMTTQIEEYCWNCAWCMVAKAGKAVKTSMGSILASKPLKVVAMDLTVLEPSSSGLENVLVITDVFTKFTQAFPTRDQKAKSVAKILVTEWFVRYGIPKRLHSDQGRKCHHQRVM